jgi:hypothetical protein
MAGQQPLTINASQSSDPQIMCGFLDSSYIYGTHVKLNGHAVAFRYHVTTDTYETIDISTIASNHMDMPIYDVDDDHYALSVGVDDQDTMFITGNHHDGISGATTSHVIQCNNVGAFITTVSTEPRSRTRTRTTTGGGYRTAPCSTSSPSPRKTRCRVVVITWRSSG